jgi:spermidine/putrescine transport system permease protein
MDATASRGALFSLRLFFAVLVLFLYLPLAVLVLFSFNDGDPSFPLEGFTTHWFGGVFGNTVLIGSLIRSMIVATVSSLLAVGLGVLASYALVRRRFFGKPAVSALLFSPLVIPYLVFGVSLLVIFTAVDKMLIGSFGREIGLGLTPWRSGTSWSRSPTDPHDHAVARAAERLLNEAAKDLGAGPWQTFRRVTFPLLLPALVSSFLIAFTLSFDEFAIASFLAGTEPTWPVFLFASLRVPRQLPQLIAVSSMVFAASLGLIIAAEVGRRLAARRYGGEFAARGMV